MRGWTTMAQPISHPIRRQFPRSMATMAYMPNVMTSASSACPHTVASGHATIPTATTSQYRRAGGASSSSARASAATIIEPDSSNSIGAISNSDVGWGRSN